MKGEYRLELNDVALQLTLTVLAAFKGYEFKDGKPEKLSPKEAAKEAAEIYVEILRIISRANTDLINQS